MIGSTRCVTTRLSGAFKPGSTGLKMGISATANRLENVSEMRIYHGPGYRIYFTQRGLELVILLAGGDKSTQQADIKTSLRLARELED